jgi:hypothetical protein
MLPNRNITPLLSFTVMSERERWVVYPLLFLALGAALRDKLFDRTTTRSIVCQELTVVDEQPIGNQPVRVLARIGRTQSADAGGPQGQLLVNGELEVVDEAVIGQQVATVTVAKVGREAPSPGSSAGGYLFLNGQLQAKVINADRYLFQGLPFAPALQAVLPWGPTDFMRALRSRLPSSSKQSTAPKAKSPQKPETSADAGAEPPLADPPENR